jgi:hypothetical protein
MLEADADGMAVDWTFPPIDCKFCCRVTAAEEQSGKMASDMEVRRKQKCAIEIIHAGNSCTSWHSSTLAERLRRPDSECEHSEAAAERQATFWAYQLMKRLDHLIRANRRITIRELCLKLNVVFNALEMIMATFEYRKVSARWVLRMLTQENKSHRKQVCQDLLDCPTTPTV